MLRRASLLGILILAISYSYLSLSAQPKDSIVIDAADTFETNALTESLTLFGLLNNVADRIGLQYSDSLRDLTISTPPSELSMNLSSVINRIRMQYADTARHLDLTAEPEPLNAQLEQVADRLIFEYPDRNRRMETAYPTELIGDSTPPSIVGQPETNLSGSSTVVTWTTDEFTTYVLRYGTSSGSYPNEVSGDLFNEQHTASLSDLSSSETYYYQIVSTDLSGNQSTSQEFVFEGTVTYSIYLPLTVR